MQFTASQIAALVSGTIEGDLEAKVHTLSRIEDGIPGSLTFLSKPEYEEYIYSTRVTILVLSKDFTPSRPLPKSCTLIRVEDPRAAFGKLLEMYAQIKSTKAGIAASAVVAKTAMLGENVYVGDLSYIGENVTIGKNVKIYQGVSIAENTNIGEGCILYPGVKVYAESQIGKYVTLHSGVVIGGDGFGFVPNSENNYSKLPHLGNVVIEDHVEIGANTTIDRATLGSTFIRKGVKLDNLIMVGHNAEIGENTVIAAQTGISGSTKIGKNCLIGGQVGIVGHISIAEGTKIAAQSGIGASITEPNTTVQGSPAFSIMDYKRSHILFRNLPELSTRIRELEQLLKELRALQEK